MTDRNSGYLLSLMACALSGTQPGEAVPEEADLAALYTLAEAHSVTGMVCMALERTRTFKESDPVLRGRWLEAKNRSIRKSLLLDTERRAIAEELEAGGIWYLPLKGSILKDWYPEYGMRDMADVDILFDPAMRGQVRDIFRQRGYTVESFGRFHHDIYKKPPVYHFEMHVSLFGERFTELADAYASVGGKLLPVAGKRFERRLSPEDFYVFIMAHAYKHATESGTGIRTLSDIFVMNRKLGAVLDRKYVEEELARIGVSRFTKDSSRLAEKLFAPDRPAGEPVLTGEEQTLLDAYLGATTYGTLENRVGNQLRSLQADSAPIRKKTKLRYLRLRLFPGREWCRGTYPFVYRHPWILPAFWVWRIVYKGIFRRKQLKSEWDSLRSGK